MTKIKRNKPDDFFSPDTQNSATHHAIHNCLLPLDKIATAMENKWGPDVLPSLVSSDTASRFGSAMARLNVAISSNNPAAVAMRAEVMIKGWKKLDEEATERGHETLPPEIWTHTTEKFKLAITRTSAEAIDAAKLARLDGFVFYSMEEVALILESKTLVNQTKAVFPGATVKSVSSKNLFDDDDIPF
jgi:hypothetical protein